MTAVFEVIEPGMLATVQDLGRHGFQHLGMTVGGAMDSYALQSANILVGNSRGAAALEFALKGPTLRAQRDCLVALCGADFNATLNGQPVPCWKSFFVRTGQTLACAAPIHGAWGYLAIAGGINVPMVMGSRSTYLRAAIGGIEGRALRRGDVLNAGISSGSGRSINLRSIPDYSCAVALRVIMGPQDECFTGKALKIFLSQPFVLSSQSDRMGYRLQGPPLQASRGDVLTDAVTFGAIQVPPDGQPIILMADCQTTGGYPKIAAVISADLSRAAQLRSGQKVSFKAITLDEAQGLASKQEHVFEEISGRNQ